jgi:type VI protein secretion system component Hcp
MLSYRQFFAASIATLTRFALLPPASATTVMEFPDDATLTGTVELQAYNFRSAPPIARQCTGTGGSGTLTITKPVDAMSPQITETSKAKKGVLLQVDDTKPDGTHVAYRLTNAVPNAIKPATGSAAPMEQISFSYTKVQWITISPCKVVAQPRRNNVDTKGLSSSGGYSGGYGGMSNRY